MDAQRFGHFLVLLTMVILVVLVLSLGVALAQGPTAGLPQGPFPWRIEQPGEETFPETSAGSLTLSWVTQRVDTLPRFSHMSDRSLAVDDAGHPHVAYGSDLLYYGWHDGTTWHLETVDTAPQVGTSASLRLDSAGRPHIGYYDQTNVGLKYAHYDGTAWHVETVDHAGPPGMAVALALDTAGRPHLAYCYAPIGDPYTCEELRHAYLDGTTWITATVAGNPGWDYPYTRISLEVDASDRPHIAYYDLTLVALQHAYYDGTAWQIETVGNYSAYYVSLALDQAGRPHIGFQDGGNGSLAYAYYDGALWNVESVQDWAGYFLSLTLDPLGRPHIGHADSGGNVLYYTYHDGASWQMESIDDEGGIGDISIALDTPGRPHITYRSNYDLRYAHHDGMAWQIETVDHEGSVGDTSLTLDATGRLHIGYCDWMQHDLKYAWNDGAAWQKQWVDRAGTYSCEGSLALDDTGRPHIAYEMSNSLRHAWSDGTTWFTETVPISWAWSISLDLDAAGRPHLSYVGGSGALEHAWYDGTTWHHETVDPDTSAFSSLVVDSADNPHIAYLAYDWAYGLWMLRYAHFSGTTWMIETADGDSGAGFYASLALDAAGRPHIGYCLSSDPPVCDDLRYAWLDGTAWHTVTVESTGNVGGYTSLALDATGRPHLSYCLHQPSHTNCDDLRYAWYDGTTWYTATVDGTGGAGRYTSLALDQAGRPHISYSDGLGDLKYAYLAERYQVYLPLAFKDDP